uniref:MbcA/ParS/Xre antitoxin family protein n=1 Tax=Ningiella ruwaisensis TaxID=2364274 RepID=UPI00109FB338|nr:MbcA/ParS/Xre antitoxin family protein [Ningiella ruwaisensis]
MEALLERTNVSRTEVVAKALFNIKDELDLSNDVVGQIIGADPATVSRMRKKMDMKENKVFEASVLMIRVYRSLYTILGGSTEAMQHWLTTNNVDFDQQKPLDKMKTIVGLVNTVEYLDAMRGHA